MEYSTAKKLQDLKERHAKIRGEILKALDGCSYYYAKYMLEEVINDLERETFVDGYREEEAECEAKNNG